MTPPLLNTCVAPCIRSHATERVYMVISSRFVKELTQLFAEHDTALRLEDLPYPHSEPASWERYEQAWRQLVALVGMECHDAMEMTPVLEKAVELLQRHIDTI